MINLLNSQIALVGYVFFSAMIVSSIARMNQQRKQF